MDEEGISILKMLEEGKITLKEATALLEAIGQTGGPSQPGQSLTDARQVTDRENLHTFRRNLQESDELSPSDNRKGRRGQEQGASFEPGREQGAGRGQGPRRAHGRSRRGKG